MVRAEFLAWVAPPVAASVALAAFSVLVAVVMPGCRTRLALSRMYPSVALAVFLVRAAVRASVRVAALAVAAGQAPVARRTSVAR
jgi:hypothetical protein